MSKLPPACGTRSSRCRSATPGRRRGGGTARCPLAGGVERAGEAAPRLSADHRSPAERAEAHGGDVGDRARPEGTGPASRPAQHLRRWERISRVGVERRAGWRSHREGRVLHDQVVVHPLEVVVGTEPEVPVGLLRRGVHPAPLIAAEGPLLVVVGDDVLAQLRADALEQVAQVADHREVAQDGVARLQQVPRPRPASPAAAAPIAAFALLAMSWSPQPAATAMTSSKPSRRVAAKTSGSGTASVSVLIPTQHEPRYDMSVMLAAEPSVAPNG
jgi:hypothetical protein